MLESGPQEPSVLNNESLYLISSSLKKYKKKILVPSLVIKISPCLKMFYFVDILSVNPHCSSCPNILVSFPVESFPEGKLYIYAALLNLEVTMWLALTNNI